MIYASSTSTLGRLASTLDRAKTVDEPRAPFARAKKKPKARAKSKAKSKERAEARAVLAEGKLRALDARIGEVERDHRAQVRATRALDAGLRARPRAGAVYDSSDPTRAILDGLGLRSVADLHAARAEAMFRAQHRFDGERRLRMMQDEHASEAGKIVHDLLVKVPV